MQSVLYISKQKSINSIIIPINKNTFLAQNNTKHSHSTQVDTIKVKLYNNYNTYAPHIIDKPDKTTNPTILFHQKTQTDKTPPKNFHRQGRIISYDNTIVISYNPDIPSYSEKYEAPFLNLNAQDTKIFPLTLTNTSKKPVAAIFRKNSVALVATTPSYLRHNLIKKLKNDNSKLTIGIHKWYTTIDTPLEVKETTVNEILKMRDDDIKGYIHAVDGFTYEQLNKMLPGKRKIPKGAKFFDNYEDYKKLEDIYTNNTFIPYKTEDGKHGILLEDSVNITGLNLDNIDAVVSTVDNEYMFTAIHTKDNKVDIYAANFNKKSSGVNYNKADLVHTITGVRSINKYRSFLSKIEDFIFVYQIDNGNIHKIKFNKQGNVEEHDKNFGDKLPIKDVYYLSKILLGGFNEENALNYLKSTCK